MHPFRFGVVGERMTTATAWTQLARRAEALGYATLLIRDHLVDDHFGNQFAPFPALTAAAFATTTLRVGTLVLDNDYRHPAMLAKEAATLDVLSDGRFELGLGAGWLAREYAAAGIPFDRAGVRIDRLAEAIPIIKGLFGPDPVTAHGVHYQIEGLIGFPRPVQRPHPPLLIGGGAPRILRLAGREASTVAFLTSTLTTGGAGNDPIDQRSARLTEKIGWVHEGAGERFDQIELSLFPDVHVTADRAAEIDAVIARNSWSGVTPADVRDMPAILIGTPDQIAADLLRWRETLGFSYLIVSADDLDPFAPVVALLAGR